jgi:RNA exonuclease 1
MVYTTAGMSIARVSVVDGSGKEVFDEQIRLDEGVDMMCVIIRISCLYLSTHVAHAAITTPVGQASSPTNTPKPH